MARPRDPPSIDLAPTPASNFYGARTTLPFFCPPGVACHQTSRPYTTHPQTQSIHPHSQGDRCALLRRGLRGFLRRRTIACIGAVSAHLRLIGAVADVCRRTIEHRRSAARCRAAPRQGPRPCVERVCPSAAACPCGAGAWAATADFGTSVR